MLKRLVVGLLEGGLSGVVVALLLGRLGFVWDTSWVVYAAAAVTGVLTGLISGKPVWARGAKTEATIKAVAGAFIATVCMFGIRKWLPGVTTDLSAIGAGAGRVADLPRVALPLVGMALALVFEVDDAFGPSEAPAVKRRVATDADKKPEDEEHDESSERRARSQRRG